MTDAAHPDLALPCPAHLPHGPGFRFVTAVDERRVLENGATYGQGHWQLTGTEPFFDHHFPGQPVVPAVLLIESLAQFCGLIHYVADADQEPVPAGIAAVDVRVLRPVTPPQTIALEATSREVAGVLTRFDVCARVGGQRVARGSLHMARSLNV